jgi:hypothetical protein
VLFVFITSYSQVKKDTKIIATITDTANVFNRLALAFYDRGYSFEQKDKELFFLATNEKKIDIGSIKIKSSIKR